MPLLASKKRSSSAIEQLDSEKKTKSRRVDQRASPPTTEASDNVALNTRKRRHEDLNVIHISETQHPWVRRRIHSPEGETILSSEASSSTVQTSSTSISEDSALESTDETSLTSDTSTATDSDSSDEELSGSSEEESRGKSRESSICESRSASPIPLIPLRKKPNIGPLRCLRDSQLPIPDGNDGSSLAARLKSFLPSLAAANAVLEEDRAAGRLAERNIENVDGTNATNGDKDGDGREGPRPYIEMNLGLGVLEERDPDASSSDSEEEDESGEEDRYEAGVDEGLKEIALSLKGGETNVLSRLMRQRRTIAKPHIQELF